MKKGFTLLELIVVIIILGVLAILGFAQYGRMVERARGAEARQILGDIRKLAAGFYLQNGTTSGFVNAQGNIGTELDKVPGTTNTDCRTSHWFWYSITTSTTNPTLNATRCTAGGKAPTAGVAGTVTMVTVPSSGSDTWGGSGDY